MDQQMIRTSSSTVSTPSYRCDSHLTADLEVGPSKQWRLTELGNQRVAILLHMHVCRYLARDAEKCAFLPPEVYQGTIDPDGRVLDELFVDDDN